VGTIGGVVRSPPGLELTSAEIEARFRWARKQGHVAYLWPDVPVDAWRACLREIEHATRLVLGSGRRDVELILPPGGDAQAAGIAAFTSGMGPLLGHWLAAGRLTAPPDVTSLLRIHLDHGRRRSARMREAMHATLQLLAANEIDTVVVKSAHTAVTYFDEPGVRPAADIDLIVPARRAAEAARVLAADGYTLLKAQRRPWKSDWSPPGSPRVLRSIEMTHADNPFTVELHDSIDRDFFGVRTLRFGRLGPGNTVPAPEIHAWARVLAQPWLTVFIAAHASEELHQLQLIRIVELIQVIRRDIGEGHTDWPEVMSAIRFIGGLRFVYPAFELAEQLSPGIVDPVARAELQAAATPQMRRVLERMSPGTAQRLEGLSLDERFLWVGGPFEMMRRVGLLLWPTRGQSRALHHVYRERVTRLLRGRVSMRRK
jgi:hypothetical protein